MALVRDEAANYGGLFFLVLVLGLNLLLLLRGPVLLGTGYRQRDILLLKAVCLFKQARGMSVQCPRRLLVENAPSQPQRSLSLPAQIRFVGDFY